MTSARMMVCLLAMLTLAGCGNEPAGNAMTNASVPGGPMPAGSPPLPGPAPTTCPMPKLDLRAAGLDGARAAAFTTNFRIALDRACKEKFFAEKPMIDPAAKDRDTIFVMDQPNANVPSIYFNREAQPPMMLFEIPFDPPAVPSADDLYEAMYCTYHGASEEEMERDGRCLPD